MIPAEDAVCHEYLTLRKPDLQPKTSAPPPLGQLPRCVDRGLCSDYAFLVAGTGWRGGMGEGRELRDAHVPVDSELVGLLRVAAPGWGLSGRSWAVCFVPATIDHGAASPREHTHTHTLTHSLTRTHTRTRTHTGVPYTLNNCSWTCKDVYTKVLATKETY